MKKIFYRLLYFTILISIILSIDVYADWFRDSNEVYTTVHISSNAEIIPLSNFYKVQQVSVNLTFFPKQYEHQEILTQQVSPDAVFNKSSIRFVWKQPKESILNFDYRADLKTVKDVPKIKEKIKFPIEELPTDVVPYIQPSQTIDSEDDDIARTASELAEGEDDLFVVVYKIADWTKNNVNYNLSTLTADVAQKASWVLQNRKGVCDELTSLFIAMLRSLDIPARFVSGVAYTNSELFPEQWGPHGWAEVYFPGYGWIPFDVTYGEYGYVDPEHLKFKESLDPDEPAVYYNWIATNVDLKTKELDIKVSNVNYNGNFDYNILLNISAEKSYINFGSYNLITAAIENLNDYYYSAEIYLSKPDEVKTISGKDIRSILLLPKEKKNVYWIVKINENLDERLIYTMPIFATFSGKNASAQFGTSRKGKFFSYDEMYKILQDSKEEILKYYSANIKLNCTPDAKEFYIYENKNMSCSIKNLGNIFLENLDVCLEKDCKSINLSITQLKKIDFSLPKYLGANNPAVSAKNNIASKSNYVEYEVLDEPKILVKNANYPENVSYNDKFNISFTLIKNSSSAPLNVNITFIQNIRKKHTSIDKLNDEKDFVIMSDGSQIKEGQNIYNISVIYHDKNKILYQTNYVFTINLVNVNLSQKLKLKLNEIAYNLSYTDINILVMIFAAAFVSFIVVVGYSFRKLNRKKELKEEKKVLK